jgi:hypothetical protein
MGLFGQAEQDQAQPHRLPRWEVPGDLPGELAAHLALLLLRVQVREVDDGTGPG